ncbi:hypothetical protein NPIL_623191 [Nephila pilipes]|uniref:Uncharacterized protein n=1 Tax=Nephila pilipes TaxID=299642 RepID=A0A8X6TWD9_NEPPI|nr:hypothetical protein NPIL_623191 [Nephila pilipes]
MSFAERGVGRSFLGRWISRCRGRKLVRFLVIVLRLLEIAQTKAILQESRVQNSSGTRWVLLDSYDGRWQHVDEHGNAGSLIEVGHALIRLSQSKGVLNSRKLRLGSGIGDIDRANVDIVKTFGQCLWTPLIQSIGHDAVSECAAIVVANTYTDPMVVGKDLGRGSSQDEGRKCLPKAGTGRGRTLESRRLAT